MSHHFRVTVTLTSDLVLRIIVFAASLIFFEVGSPILVCGWWSVVYHLRVTLTFDPVLRIIVSGAYILYNLR